MAMNNDAKNSMLDHLGTEVLYMSLHSGYPATTGNEITGGSPAYARKSVTWSAASGGSMSASNQPAFDVPACTVAAVGFFSALTSGTLYGDYDVTDEVFAAQGTYTVTSCSINLNA
jgi:hypothetical protein